MFENYVNVFTMSFFWSTLLMGFFVIKGGFQKKFLFTDSPIIAFITTFLVILIESMVAVHLLLKFFIVIPGISLLLFIILSLYRFFRNPNRKIPIDDKLVLSPADGRIIYIKEIDEGNLPVSIKKKNLYRLEEITKTKILKTPCYLIGIAMTLFDVHYNRAPVEGVVSLIKHTDGVALGLRNPESTFLNERNTFVIDTKKNEQFGVIQIAARGVRRCISTVQEGEIVSQGQIIGKIRFGSQVDIILPRYYTIKIREGDQVYGGTSIIAENDKKLELSV